MALKPESAGELRGMVRDLLREALANRPSAGLEPVRIADDRDLSAFIARLIQPASLEAIRAGKLRFTLQNGTASGAGLLEGVITEQKLEKLNGAGTLVLGASAVLTPLARDRARRLGIKIERRR